MITFTQTEFITYVFGLLILIVILHGNASYWKAKFEMANKNNNDGWIEEARFLRRLVNKEAAEEVEY